MQVKSVYKYARMSAQKAREVTRAITGMPVSRALSVLDFTPKKAAFLVGKTLRSAVANAENNHELDAEELIVQSAVATSGPALKRIMPRARGSAAPIKKRMCHITIVLGPKDGGAQAEPDEAAAASAEPDAGAKPSARKSASRKKAPAAAKAKAPAKKAAPRKSSK